MKIRLFTAIILFCVLFAALLTSCRDNTGADSEIDTGTETVADTETETAAPVTDTEPVETEPADIEPDESLRIPIENEKALEMIEYQYNKAAEVVDWAENGTLTADLNIEIAAEDGRIYFPVTDEAQRPELGGSPIVTFADLSKYINSIFARSIADDLIDLAKKQYREIDGVLCREADYVDTEPKVSLPADETETAEIQEGNAPKVISTEFFLSKFTDTLFRYTAKVTYESEEISEIPSEETEAIPTENAEYFDFVFENTGSGWYWTAFPNLPE
ncbi:MAG: hypothetical protein IJZ89_08205 [Clostridia bacterium]|nr:hypothetical protein [Clostridia bacterium]